MLFFIPYTTFAAGKGVLLLLVISCFLVNQLYFYFKRGAVVVASFF